MAETFYSLETLYNLSPEVIKALCRALGELLPERTNQRDLDRGLGSAFWNVHLLRWEYHLIKSGLFSSQEGFPKEFGYSVKQLKEMKFFLGLEYRTLF